MGPLKNWGEIAYGAFSPINRELVYFYYGGWVYEMSVDV